MLGHLAPQKELSPLPRLVKIVALEHILLRRHQSAASAVLVHTVLLRRQRLLPRVSSVRQALHIQTRGPRKKKTVLAVLLGHRLLLGWHHARYANLDTTLRLLRQYAWIVVLVSSPPPTLPPCAATARLEHLLLQAPLSAVAVLLGIHL
jgi:hypothetical protein